VFVGHFGFVNFALDIDGLIVITECGQRKYHQCTNPLNYAYLSCFNLTIIAFVGCFLCPFRLGSPSPRFLSIVSRKYCKCWRLGLVFPIAADSREPIADWKLSISLGFIIHLYGPAIDLSCASGYMTNPLKAQQINCWLTATVSWNSKVLGLQKCQDFQEFLVKNIWRWV